MTRDEAFLILDVADWHAGAWPGLFGHAGEVAGRIPPEKRPTVVQASREVAERELLRLAERHPQGRFVLFTATHLAGKKAAGRMLDGCEWNEAPA